MVMATHGITLFNANASIFIPPPSPPYTLRTLLADSIRCRFSALPSISLHLNSAPKGLRRHLLVSATSLWGAVTSLMGANSGREAAFAVKRGMQLFVRGDVQESVVEFDKALELDPRQKAYLWQRGLSLYYLNRFEEGAAQFREDVAANPNDTEESIWCFLCEARLYGVDEARRRFLEVGPDPRPVMCKAYEMFKNGGKPDELIAEFSNGTEHDYFYATLYAGLYHEVQGRLKSWRVSALNAVQHLVLRFSSLQDVINSQNDSLAAEAAITAACRSSYGSRSGDYMAFLAKVHCQCRGWKVEGSSFT